MKTIKDGYYTNKKTGRSILAIDSVCYAYDLTEKRTSSQVVYSEIHINVLQSMLLNWTYSENRPK